MLHITYTFKIVTCNIVKQMLVQRTLMESLRAFWTALSSRHSGIGAVRNGALHLPTYHISSTTGAMLAWVVERRDTLTFF